MIIVLCPNTTPLPLGDPDNPDSRFKLTWSNRFKDVTQNAYNFYSTGDESLEIFAGTPASTEGLDFHLGVPVVTGYERYVWHKQEVYKGRDGEGEFEGLFGTDMAGWGFEKKVVGDYIYPYYSASQANAEDPQTFSTLPAFRTSPDVMFSPTITKANQDMILAKAIPVLSGPTGSRAISFPPSVTEKRDFDMNTEFERPSGWPRSDGDYGTRWLHNDIKNVAYFYNFCLFDDFVQKGSLK